MHGLMSSIGFRIFWKVFCQALRQVRNIARLRISRWTDRLEIKPEWTRAARLLPARLPPHSELNQIARLHPAEYCQITWATQNRTLKARATQISHYRNKKDFNYNDLESKSGAQERHKLQAASKQEWPRFQPIQKQDRFKTQTFWKRKVFQNSGNTTFQNVQKFDRKPKARGCAV